MTDDRTVEGQGDQGSVLDARGIGVLRRLLRERQRSVVDGGRVPQLPQPAPPTPARAAATALGRAANRLYGLGVQPIGIEPGGLTLAELPELLPHPALLAVLQGPRDSVGVVALNPETVTSLIEIQTIGRVTRRPVERRPLTRSDAMLCADFVDAFLSELAQEAKGVAGLEGLEGYRYVTHLDDARPLALMMEDKPYRSLRMTVRMGGGETREATIFLALPQPDSITGRPVTAAVDAVADAHTSDVVVPEEKQVSTPGDGIAPADLSGSVPEAPVEVVGILCRRRISLRELRSIAPGRTLALPRLDLAGARLETVDGQLLATGKFGEAEGCHAIRLRDPAMAGDRVNSQDPVTPSVPVAIGADVALAEIHPVDDIAEPDGFRHTASGTAEIVPAVAVGDFKTGKGS